MKKHKISSSKNLASLLGLDESSAIEAKLKSDLMEKIRKEVSKRGLTHQEVADLSGVGRTVVTGIVNSSIQKITIDRLVRVVASLGVSLEFKFKKAA